MSKITDDHERKLKARALRLLRADDAPRRQLAEYMERARELLAIEEHPSAGLLPNPTTEHRAEAPGAEPIEEAALMENLGEFPVGLTDQGDRSTAPLTKQKARQILRES